MVMEATNSEHRQHEEITTLRLPIRLSRTEMSDLALRIAKLQSDEADGDSQAYCNDKKTIALANARALLRIYRTREKIFPQGKFSDPGWHLLIDLFLQQAAGKDVSVSSACVGSRAPSTTALRYITDYIEKGVVVRTPSEHDQRVYWLSLSEEALARLVDLFGDDFM